MKFTTAVALLVASASADSDATTTAAPATAGSTSGFVPCDVQVSCNAKLSTTTNKVTDAQCFGLDAGGAYKSMPASFTAQYPSGVTGCYRISTLRSGLNGKFASYGG